MIDIATIEYASNTPIDNILTNAVRSKTAAKKAVNTAAHNVAMTGVLNRCDIN
jgi:hypothetical protein